MNSKNNISLRLALLFQLASLFLFTNCSIGSDMVEIEVLGDYSAIVVSGISKTDLKEAINTSSPPYSLSVFILGESETLKNGQLPISGVVSADHEKLIFSPRYSLSAGNSYLIKFNYKDLSLEKKFNIPGLDTTPINQISEVYPTSTLLPRNILKFYIQFSDSMAQGFSYQNITLVNSRQDTIKNAFLELEEELWSSDMKRFTLLLDPGRIKRGLGSQDDLGYTFNISNNYRLIINSEWPDAWGRNLIKSFSKSFSIGPDDRTKPNAAQWNITPPAMGSNDNLVLEFNEMIDYALANRVIEILDSDNRILEGEIRLGENESTWHFSPQKIWQVGSYRIRIALILEDLSGNNFKNVFDVDNQTENTDLSSMVYRYLPFSIK